MTLRRVPWLLLVALWIPFGAASAASIALGRSTLPLEGPWKFHLGDDLRWADPGFDDSGWETADFKAAPGSTDGDVGLTGYVSGWNAKGHTGYQGYAWYRIHLDTARPAGQDLALLGPWAVDSAYQVYANGGLLGGIGDFSGATPKAYGYHYPRMFELPSQIAQGGPIVFAIRVWMGPWGVAVPDGGGIHIAPVIGERSAIDALYHMQWLKIFEGYAVDAVAALLFFLMALITLCLLPFDRADRTYLWLACALLLSGIQRGNQAFFFWWQIETIQDFVYVIIVLVGSLCLGAWMMAWRNWFKLGTPAWLPRVVAGLTVMLMIAQWLGHPWLFYAAFPRPVSTAVHYLINGLRLAFLLVFLMTIYGGIRRQGREGFYALPAALAIGVVLFTAELSALHVPGIWFPWGIGLSLSEYASLVFDVLLAVLLLRRLWSFAPRRVWASS